MSELFSLGKRAGLHSGSDTKQFNGIAVFKPKGYPSTPEVPEIISIIITSKETEETAGVQNALVFDLTPKETEDLIRALQGAIKKEATPQEDNYIGTKMYLTERGRELYGYTDVPLASEWEVTAIKDKSIVTLHNKQFGYFTIATYASLFMHLGQQDFTLSKPEERLPNEHPLVGKKVRLTEKAIIALGLRPSMWGNVGRIESVDKDGFCELLFDDHGVRAVLIDHTSANPDFEIVEDPKAPHLKVQDIHMVLPDISGYHTVLDAAKSLVYGERVNDYGKTSDNFKNICAGWKIIFEPGFTPERVGLAMAWLKICRASNDNCEKQDSLVDLAGYAACIEKIKKDL